MPWKPGQSGNPGGKVKSAVEIRDLARAGCPEAIQNLIKLMSNEDPTVSLKASEAVLNRGYGKPHQAVYVSGAEGGPITFTWLPPIEPDEPELPDLVPRIAAE